VKLHDFKQITGPPGIVAPNEKSNVNVILQHCGDTNVYIPRKLLLGKCKKFCNQWAKIKKYQASYIKKQQPNFIGTQKG
jgi:hypothetical protein